MSGARSTYDLGVRLAVIGLSLASLTAPISASPEKRPSILDSLVAALSYSMDSGAGEELAASTPATPKQLVAAGLEKRRAGMLDEAEVLFHAATVKAPESSTAHYELASVHAVQRQQDPCFFPIEEIVARVASAVRLDQKQLERARQDPSFDEIKGEVAFRMLLHSTLPRAEAYAKVFEGSELRGANGAMRDSLLRLDAGGVARRLAPLESDHGPYTGEVSRGAWRLVGEAVHLEIDRVSGEYAVSATGGFGDWSSSFQDECGSAPRPDVPPWDNCP